MAVVAHRKTESVDDLGDITSNLASLQFESALLESEQELLNLRVRSHAHTVSACAQATYFVYILNEARQIQRQLKNPTARRATRLIQDTATRDNVRIGIIGCGRLGCHLAHSLLTFAEVAPNELLISTRRPETLVDLQQKKVVCVSNNASVAARVQLLFVCVLPSQFPSVADDIKSSLSADCVVYSLVSALPVPRAKQLLGHSNLIRPEFELTPLESCPRWDYRQDVTGAYAVREMLEKTCPLSSQKQDSVVCTKEKLAEQMVYALVNVCTAAEMTRKDTVDIVNAVVLGHTGSNSGTAACLTLDDITKYQPKDTQMFPHFDLSATINRDTPLTKALCTDPAIRDAFVERYCYAFQQYMDWRNTSLAQARKQLHVV